MKLTKIVLSGILLLNVQTLPVLAHGVDVKYKIQGQNASGATVTFNNQAAPPGVRVNRVEINALYRDNTPMSGASLKIYAPDNRQQPWREGTCDRQGRFSFTPDRSKPGIWEVEVRHNGHTDLIRISINR